MEIDKLEAKCMHATNGLCGSPRDLECNPNFKAGPLDSNFLSPTLLKNILICFGLPTSRRRSARGFNFQLHKLDQLAVGNCVGLRYKSYKSLK